MKRKLLCAFALCFLSVSALADAPDETERLVVYTSHKEEVYQPIVEEFERRTGVWVQVVSGGTTELLERIAAEAETPVADVMFGGGVESLLAYEDYFMPCDAPRDAMLAECRFENHRFVAFSRLPLAIIYNPRLVSRPPAGFADLLDDGLRGQIAFANPAVSGSSFTVLATLMQALDEHFSFARFLLDNGSPMNEEQAMYSVASPAELPEIAGLLQRNRLLALARTGVEIYDASSCYVEPSVRVAPGARLLPGTMLRGKTVIGEEAVIGPWSVIDDSVIGARAVVNASQVRESRVGQDAVVGPYASVRGGCELGRSVRAGSFVELKNARLGENTQVPHLAYLGDTEAGANCNFGCGVTTANFDRVQKHETVVGEGAFIGCNTALIAPLQVGSGAYIGAGSTITEDVPAQALGIARASNKKEWAAKHKK